MVAGLTFRAGMNAGHPQSEPSPDDAAIIARVLAGDTAAFEIIVRRWQGPLVHLAWRFCRDRSRAEEMAQEAFLRAYRNLAHFRGESAFSTWLFAVAANVCRTELGRMPATPLSLDAIAEPHDPRIAGLAAFEQSTRDEAVRRAVLALPAKYRDAILLFYFHEQDVPAAARTLRVPEGTVKARLFRGRAMLRAKFSRSLSPPRSAAGSAPLPAQSPKEAQTR